jgi:hypothetical protein
LNPFHEWDDKRDKRTSTQFTVALRRRAKPSAGQGKLPWLSETTLPQKRSFLIHLRHNVEQVNAS